jgi:pectate lyase
VNALPRLAIALYLPACAVHIGDPSGRACDATHPCAGNQRCVAGLCRIPAVGDGGPLPAFPGAQGGGAASAGGRGPWDGGYGGVVFEVTNLNDSGAGSLRACIEAAGPRTCVFRVAGVITDLSEVKVSNPYLTIAGQTAPGGGIIIGGPSSSGEPLRVSTHDVVVRYLTCSGDNPGIPPGSSGSLCFEVVNGAENDNIIFDHVTSRWAGNALWGTISNYNGPNHDITLQWSLLYEPNQAHPLGLGTATNPTCVSTPSSPCFSAGETNIDFHHNLFANIGWSIPANSNASTRWINNITFDWSQYAAEFLGKTTVDVIGNEWRTGNLSTSAQAHPIHFSSNNAQLPGEPSVYLAGNLGPGLPDGGDPYLLAAEISGDGAPETGPIDAGWRRSAPMPGTAFPIVPDNVATLEASLTAGVGNSSGIDCDGNWFVRRNAQDTRVVNQLESSSQGALFNGTPADDPIAPGTPCASSLHDGIPDQWKVDNGLSLTDTTLAHAVAPNGFTYLESYLDGIPLYVSPPPGGPLYDGYGCSQAPFDGGAAPAAILWLAVRRRRRRQRPFAC